jgi:O-antigen/teichoic acid export membrane protein
MARGHDGGGTAPPPPDEVGLPEVSSASELGSRTVRNSLYLLAARTLSRLVALVVVVVMANHLHPGNYGRFTTAITYSALVSIVADLGLNPLYTREAARDRAGLPRYLGLLMSGKVVLSLIAAVLLGGALSLAGLGSLVVPVVVLLTLTNYAQLLRNTFYAVGRLEFEAVAVVAEIAIQAGLILYGVRHAAGVSYFVWAYAASYGFTVVYCLVLIPLLGLGRPRLNLDFALFRTWLKLSFPFALGLLLTNLYFKADVPILQHFKSFSEVGWYTLAYKPFEATQFVPLAVQTVVYPVLAVYYRSAQDRLAAAYEKFFKVLVLLGWPITVGTFMLVHPIGRLFRLFPESEPALRILSLAIVFLFVNSAFTAMLYSIDRQDLFAWTTGIAVVVNIGLNLLFIPVYGYLAASAVTVVTELTFSVAGWWFVARQRYRLPWLRLSWRVVVAGAVMGAVLVPLAGRSIFVAVPAGLVAYVAALWLLRAVDREEIDLFIGGLRPRR